MAHEHDRPQRLAILIDAENASPRIVKGLFDEVCLVSSDSDFTRLAARIREQGVDVYGFGERKTPESFRRACKRFVYTEEFAQARSRCGPARQL